MPGLTKFAMQCGVCLLACAAFVSSARDAVAADESPLKHGGAASVAAASRTGLNADFGPYMSELQRHIKRHWFPPKSDVSRRVVTSFSISHDGNLSNLRIVHSCGVSLGDFAALHAVREASPFAALPKGAPESVDISFAFDYDPRFDRVNASVDEHRQDVEKALRAAVSETGTKYGADSPQACAALAQLGRFYVNAKRYGDAQQQFSKEAEALKHKGLAASSEYGDARHFVADTLAQQKQEAASREAYEDAIAVHEKLHDSKAVADILLGEARYLDGPLGHHEQTRDLLMRSLQFRDDYPFLRAEPWAMTYDLLATQLVAIGNKDNAIETFKHAIEYPALAHGTDSPDTIEGVAALADLYSKFNDDEQAAVLYQQCVERAVAGKKMDFEAFERILHKDADVLARLNRQDEAMKVAGSLKDMAAARHTKYWEDLAKAQPKAANYIGLAQALRLEKRYPEAITACNSALKLADESDTRQLLDEIKRESQSSTNVKATP